MLMTFKPVASNFYFFLLDFWNFLSPLKMSTCYFVSQPGDVTVVELNN